MAACALKVSGEFQVQSSIRPRALGLCVGLFVVLTCSACVQVGYERETRLEPLPQGALEKLTPGVSDLKTALDLLGPPIFVWELPEQGSALAWGWYSSVGWKVRVSDGNKGEVSASFNYERAAEHMHGAVLFFNRAWQLTAVREGVLSELRDDSRVRPDAVDTEQ